MTEEKDKHMVKAIKDGLKSGLVSKKKVMKNLKKAKILRGRASIWAKINYKIEKGIPIPNNKPESKYPFAQMKVGDSFSLGRFKKFCTLNITSSARRWCIANKKDWKFVSRKDKSVLRVWRVK